MVCIFKLFGVQLMKEKFKCFTPFQIVKDGDNIYIVNTNTGTKGPTLKNGADALKSLKRMQARLNSSYALDRMGIY